ncbi:unnamed protein product [Laminaria digitata]
MNLCRSPNHNQHFLSARFLYRCPLQNVKGLHLPKKRCSATDLLVDCHLRDLSVNPQFFFAHAQECLISARPDQIGPEDNTQHCNSPTSLSSPAPPFSRLVLFLVLSYPAGGACPPPPPCRLAVARPRNVQAVTCGEHDHQRLPGRVSCGRRRRP